MKHFYQFFINVITQFALSFNVSNSSLPKPIIKMKKTRNAPKIMKISL